MDDVGFGRLLRAVRIRRGWRQSDVAARAGVSRARVSIAERGRVEEVSLAEIRRIGSALEVRAKLEPSWRGGDADRLVNAAHSALQTQCAGILVANGWTVVPEVTFSIRGERGAIDLLGWREDMGALAVVEVKTVLLDPGSLVAQVDRYRRLARSVSSERGWRPTTIGVWVVIAESTMNRGAIEPRSAPASGVPRQDRPRASLASRTRGSAVGPHLLALRCYREHCAGRSPRSSRLRRARTLRGSAEHCAMSRSTDPAQEA